jgi:uncharacterized membrane protein YgcG
MRAAAESAQDAKDKAAGKTDGKGSSSSSSNGPSLKVPAVSVTAAPSDDEAGGPSEDATAPGPAARTGPGSSSLGPPTLASLVASNRHAELSMELDAAEDRKATFTATMRTRSVEHGGDRTLFGHACHLGHVQCALAILRFAAAVANSGKSGGGGGGNGGGGGGGARSALNEDIDEAGKDRVSALIELCDTPNAAVHAEGNVGDVSNADVQNADVQNADVQNADGKSKDPGGSGDEPKPAADDVSASPSAATHRPSYDSSVARLVTRLVELGAAVNAMDHDGRTPVLIAASRRWRATAAALIRGGANPHITDVNGVSAMSGALEMGDDALVEILEQEVGESSDSEHGSDGSSRDGGDGAAAGPGGEGSGSGGGGASAAAAGLARRDASRMVSGTLVDAGGGERPHLLRVTALASYSASGPNQISLRVGDPVEVLAFGDSGWWEGRIDDGTIGYFPANHTTGESFRTLTSWECARAIASYAKQQEDEVDLLDRDVVIVLRREQDGWWLIQAPGGKVGLVPSNHLVPVP